MIPYYPSHLKTIHKFKRALPLVFVLFYALAWGQSDFNTNSHLAIDFSYFPYLSGTNFFSAELQAKRKKQYLFVGANLSNYFKIYNSMQYGIKLGYGIYPYRNAKRLKWHHRVNYFYEMDSREKDWQAHYLVLGNGAEYWIANKFTIGLNANMCWGYTRSDGDQFVFQPLVTAKFIFIEK